MKKVQVKASTRNGKKVKAHTRTVKEGKKSPTGKITKTSKDGSKVSDYRKSGQAEIDTLEEMKKSLPSKDYINNLKEATRHKNPVVSAYAKKRLHKSLNPKGNSMIKEAIDKQFPNKKTIKNGSKSKKSKGGPNLGRVKNGMEYDMDNMPVNSRKSKKGNASSYISKTGDIKTGEALYKSNKYRSKELKKYNY